MVRLLFSNGKKCPSNTGEDAFLGRFCCAPCASSLPFFSNQKRASLPLSLMTFCTLCRTPACRPTPRILIPGHIVVMRGNGRRFNCRRSCLLLQRKPRNERDHLHGSCRTASAIGTEGGAERFIVRWDLGRLDCQLN